MTHLQVGIRESRERLLDCFGDDLTFLTGWGNVGDSLIYAGTRQLLSQLEYQEKRLGDLHDVSGQTALVTGSGGWCGPYHRMAACLPLIEDRFEKVIVLPSSFDVGIAEVREALSRTRALVFAREEESYKQIRSLCRAELAYDCAFFFDFRPYLREGKGVLNSFRTDREAVPFQLPQDNNDISLTCRSLDEWLWMIARHSEIRTDRAHVTIAAAMLGKRVLYRSSCYHKLPAVVQYSLRQTDVQPLDEATTQVNGNDAQDPAMCHNGRATRAWTDALHELTDELAELIPPNCSYILVDQNQLGILPLAQRQTIPFLERGGRYWGPPANDTSAIQELERLREAAPYSIVFAWPAFWWLEHYGEFHLHLQTHYRYLVQNDRLIAFDLLSPPRDHE